MSLARAVTVAACIGQSAALALISTKAEQAMDSAMNAALNEHWSDTHGMESYHEEKALENDQVAVRINQTLAEGPKRLAQCTRFLLLTTSKAGGTWLMNSLEDEDADLFRTGLDALNWRDGKAGSLMLRIERFVSDYQGDQTREQVLKNLGSQIWAEHAWRLIEKGENKNQKVKRGLKDLNPDKCATGFQVLGPDADTFSTDELTNLLSDNSVKKIILERTSRKDQYFSRQWSCMLQWSQHRREEKDFDWKKFVRQEIKAGKACKVGPSNTEAEYKQRSEALYASWRNTLRSNQQAWLELTTEDLPDDLEHSRVLRRVKQYVFPNMMNEDEKEILKEERAFDIAERKKKAAKKSRAAKKAAHEDERETRLENIKRESENEYQSDDEIIDELDEDELTEEEVDEAALDADDDVDLDEDEDEESEEIVVGKHQKQNKQNKGLGRLKQNKQSKQNADKRNKQTHDKRQKAKANGKKNAKAKKAAVQDTEGKSSEGVWGFFKSVLGR